MRIVIDMQGAQTESRFRGIGRYTLSLAQAICRNRGEHEVILALNGLLSESIEPIHVAFEGLLPKENIRVWCAPGPVREMEPWNNGRREVAELIREAFLASLKPDVIHVSSLFEGYIDDAVTTVGLFDQSIPVSVSLYDLIPLLNPDLYLKPNPNYGHYYRRKIEYLNRAKISLAISGCSKQEGLSHLNLPDSAVINISTAIEPHFRPINIEEKASSILRRKFGLTRPFVLHTGGADERKNLARLIQAFASLPGNLRKKHQLVLTGKISQGELNNLQHHARSAGLKTDEICFAGYVSEEELVLLYNLCRLFVLPSWHEGFGLPALEAIACGAAAIGANTSSLPEVIGIDAALFNPFDVSSIASKITQALTDESFRSELQAHGLRQAQRFSWDKSAQRAIAAFEQTRSNIGAGLKRSSETWNSCRNRLADIYQRLVINIAAVFGKKPSPKETDLVNIASCIERNERQVDIIVRSAVLPERLTWRIEGPFDSSYSLALINREIARSLDGLGHNVVLHSTEGPGDFQPNAKFLTENPDLAIMHMRASQVTQVDSDATSRNIYPPRVIDMQARLNFLHSYGWEETGFPHDWIHSFNLSLQGMTVMSEHVRKVMIDNGVKVPISVSGVGVDHWERVVPDITYSLDARKFCFLHVSSCFPRKGADCLLRSYGKSFRASDDVSLIIKTFSNPHNQIHHWLEEARTGDFEFPDVQILEGEYSDAEMKALYEQCHALVAPSRAEGFGLPMAEAMLSGLAVITTGWSGQVDFCTRETAWLIDFNFEPAATHFELFGSVWAAPQVEHLSQIMREVYETPKSIRDVRISAGQKLLREKFRWSHVVERIVESARIWSRMPEITSPRIGWVTTWNTRCGIATYSEQLLKNMPCQVQVLAAYAQELTCPDDANVVRCWDGGDRDSLSSLKHSIEESRLNTVVIQFNFGFFCLNALANLIIEQVDSGRVIVVILHSTTDPVNSPEKKLSILIPALLRCHRVLVHTRSDMNRLKKHGLIENVALFPHGILDYSSPAKELANRTKDFIIASYGFFLPNKGLLELIDAVALLRSRGKRIRLNMINAEYPVPESKEIIELALKKVKSLGLVDAVCVCTEFLDDSESLSRLSEADLIVFPYQNTGESVSGAVRYGIASGRPVAVTPLAIFDDVKSVVYYLPGHSAEQIADGIEKLLPKLINGDANVVKKNELANRWRAAHRYSLVSQRLYGMLVALLRARNENHRAI